MSRIIKRASLVTLGTAGGQLISFMASLALVRIYSPEAMGIFTTIVAVATCLAPLFSGRIEIAIPLPGSDRESIKLGIIAIAGALIGAVLLLGLYIVLTLGGIELLPQSSIWAWAVPAILVSLTIYLSAHQLAVRFGAHKVLALRGVLYPLLLALSQVLLGLMHFGPDGLIVGIVIAHIITALTMWTPLLNKVQSDTAAAQTDRNSPSSWTNLLSEYRRFPRYLGPAGVINSLAVYLPQLGVAFMFGMSAAGQFGLMSQILSVPVALVAQSIGYIYVGEVAKLKRKGITNVRKLYDQLSLRLFLLSLVMVLGVVFFAEPVFTWLLGQEWRDAGVFAAYFVISPASKLIALPLSQTLIISGRAGLQLTIDLIRSASLLMVLFITWFTGVGVELTVLALGVVSAAGYGITWLINRKFALSLAG